MRISFRTAPFAAVLLFGSLMASLAWGQNGPRPTTGPGLSGNRPTTTPATAPATNRPANPAPATASGSSGGTTVVVIDISEVFKNHTRFKAQMDAIKDEVKKLEEGAQGEQKTLAKMREKLNELNPGTPEFKKMEEDFAKRGSGLNVEMQLQQKGLMEKEAKIYYDTYMEVYDLISDFSERNGIGLVLRYTRQDMDPQKRDTVLAGVNRPIVYQKQLDITDLIIGMVNKGGPQMSQRPGVGTPKSPR